MRAASQATRAATGMSLQGGDSVAALPKCGAVRAQALARCPLQGLIKEGMEPGEARRRVDQLRRDCEGLIGECLEAVSGELSFFTLPNCFELFGFDLLVTLPKPCVL